jgi:hypothetical protein
MLVRFVLTLFLSVFAVSGAYAKGKVKIVSKACHCLCPLPSNAEGYWVNQVSSETGGCAALNHKKFCPYTIKNFDSEGLDKVIYSKLIQCAPGFMTVEK